MTVNPAYMSGPMPNAAENAKKIRIVGEGDEAQSQKDLFLKLMIAQLKNQDPTSPMDQKDMMASMTQFSQVEQMQNMTKAMETLSLAQGVGMIGQEVEYHYTLRNEDGTFEVDEMRDGKVAHIEQRAGAVLLVLENGVKVKPADVTRVGAAA